MAKEKMLGMKRVAKIVLLSLCIIPCAGALCAVIYDAFFFSFGISKFLSLFALPIAILLGILGFKFSLSKSGGKEKKLVPFFLISSVLLSQDFFEMLYPYSFYTTPHGLYGYLFVFFLACGLIIAITLLILGIRFWRSKSNEKEKKLGLLMMISSVFASREFIAILYFLILTLCGVDWFPAQQ